MTEGLNKALVKTGIILRMLYPEKQTNHYALWWLDLLANKDPIVRQKDIP